MQEGKKFYQQNKLVLHSWDIFLYTGKERKNKDRRMEMKYKHRLTALTAMACAAALTACSGQSGSQAGTWAGDPVQREFFLPWIPT